MEKESFYTLKNILSFNADYNVIYGERSNGKTTAVLDYGLQDHINSGYVNQMAIVRRMETDFVGKNGKQMFEGIVSLGWVSKYTNDKYNSIYYYSQRWFLCKYDDNGEMISKAENPFAYGFSISSEEHYKSTTYPNITTILFDEFISRKHYLNDEFISFQNLLSTLIRLRTNVKIFMCGNTINKYCPYFSEMGLYDIEKQKRGTIDIYTYGDSGLTVATEYSDFPTKHKKSNKYFAFNNPKLKMITEGGWEIDIYPHLPVKFKPKDVLYRFFIMFDRKILEGKIIHADNSTFIYIHRKTSDIRDDNTNLVYYEIPTHKRWYRTNMLKPYGKIDKRIYMLIKEDKIFYQDNEIGEIMNNYFNWCKQN